MIYLSYILYYISVDKYNIKPISINLYTATSESKVTKDSKRFNVII